MKLGWTLVIFASCAFPRPADVGPMDGGSGTDDANGGNNPGSTECQLTAIEPALANTNDKITINGTFIGSVTVNFPGGTRVAATVLGPHRAVVAVPSSATEGGLTVTTCDSTLGALPFRRASFGTGMAGFEATFAQDAGARQTPKLLIAREAPTAALVGRYLYVLGGAATAGSVASVDQAKVNADGSLGAFVPNPGGALAIARQGHTTVTIGSYLYVLGGSGNGSLNSVERAVIARDDSLGPFAVVPGVTLAAVRTRHASVVIGNSLYVLGGLGSGPLDSVERATINADGTLGVFATVPGVHLGTARHGHTAAVVGSYLYVVGGTGSQGALGDVERATIGPDGSLGHFDAVAGITLNTARSGHTAVVIGNVLYVVGGLGAGSPLASVERGPLDSAGVLGSFTTSPDALLTARHGQAMAVIGNYVYVLGGAGSTTLSSIERATLNLSGTLDPPATTGAAFVAPRFESAAVVIGNYLYVIGGGITGASNTIERAAINSDGTLTPFATASDIALVTPRRRHTTAVVGNYLYVVGGADANGPVKTIERAAINVDGSLGPFSNSVALTGPRTSHTSAVIGTFLYVIGGNNATTFLTSVERATINDDGSLGLFATVSGVSLQTARQGQRSIAIRSFLYVVGGDTGNIERATINADGSLGPFVPVAASLANTERFEATSTIVGNHLYVLGGDAVFGQGDSESTFVAADGSLVSFAIGPLGPTLRSGHSTVVVGNYLYVIGGAGTSGQPADPSVYSLKLN